MSAWPPAAVAKKRRSKRRLLRDVIVRDGLECFFCAVALTESTITLEHLVAHIHGGPNHISNLVGACEPCNHAAGHLSVMEKVKIREANRAKKSWLSTIKPQESEQ